MTKTKTYLIFFIVWIVLALASLIPVSRGLKGAFPIFPVLWILVPIIAVLVSKDPGRVGFRRVPARRLLLTIAINLGVLLLLMLAFEPWSHAYQKLVQAAMSGN